MPGQAARDWPAPRAKGARNRRDAPCAAWSFGNRSRHRRRQRPRQLGPGHRCWTGPLRRGRASGPLVVGRESLKRAGKPRIIERTPPQAVDRAGPRGSMR